MIIRQVAGLTHTFRVQESIIVWTVDCKFISTKLPITWGTHVFGIVLSSMMRTLGDSHHVSFGFRILHFIVLCLRWSNLRCLLLQKWFGLRRFLFLVYSITWLIKWSLHIQITIHEFVFIRCFSKLLIKKRITFLIFIIILPNHGIRWRSIWLLLLLRFILVLLISSNTVRNLSLDEVLPQVWIELTGRIGGVTCLLMVYHLGK